MDTALGLVGLLLLIGGFVAALMLAVAPSPPTWLSGAVAAALVFQAVYLVLLARERDTYFDPEHVTRWEFAARDGNQWFVVAPIVAALAAGAGLLVGIVSSGRWIRRVAAVAGAISFVLVLMASFVLTVGH